MVLNSVSFLCAEPVNQNCIVNWSKVPWASISHPVTQTAPSLSSPCPWGSPTSAACTWSSCAPGTWEGTLLPRQEYFAGTIQNATIQWCMKYIKLCYPQHLQSEIPWPGQETESFCSGVATTFAATSFPLASALSWTHANLGPLQQQSTKYQSVNTQAPKRDWCISFKFNLWHLGVCINLLVKLSQFLGHTTSKNHAQDALCIKGSGSTSGNGDFSASGAKSSSTWLPTEAKKGVIGLILETQTRLFNCMNPLDLCDMRWMRQEDLQRIPTRTMFTGKDTTNIYLKRCHTPALVTGCSLKIFVTSAPPRKNKSFNCWFIFSNSYASMCSHPINGRWQCFASLLDLIAAAGLIATDPTKTIHRWFAYKKVAQFLYKDLWTVFSPLLAHDPASPKINTKTNGFEARFFLFKSNTKICKILNFFGQIKTKAFLTSQRPSKPGISEGTQKDRDETSLKTMVLNSVSFLCAEPVNQNCIVNWSKVPWASISHPVTQTAPSLSSPCPWGSPTSAACTWSSFASGTWRHAAAKTRILCRNHAECYNTMMYEIY